MPDQDTARKVIEKRENRKTVENVLQAMTENVRRFTLVQQERPVAGAGSTPKNGLLVTETVNPEDGQAALSGP